MSEDKINTKLFPLEGEPLLITDCKNKAVRARLIEIENRNQPNRRKKNAIHIQLFDKIKVGKLKRIEMDLMEINSDHKMSVEEGYFLCNRNIKDIVIFHSDSQKPTCKKCIQIANRLLSKGLKIYLLDLNTWNKLQDIKINNQVISMAKNIDLSEMNDLIKKLVPK